MIFTFSDTSDWRSTISFFNKENFQKWSIVNHDIKHGGTWETYKQPAKDYINKYIKDETYRKNKTKEPSLIKVLAEAVEINMIMNIDKKEEMTLVDLNLC